MEIQEKRIETKGMTLFQAIHRIAKETLKGRTAYFSSESGKIFIISKGG